MTRHLTIKSFDKNGRRRKRLVSNRWTLWFARKSWARITRTEFYLAGGLSNSQLVRKGVKTGWSYWRVLR